MKKYIILVILLCIPISVGAWGLLNQMGGVPATGCTTLIQENDGTSVSNYEVGRWSSTVGIAMQFTASETTTVCSISVRVEEVGTASHNFEIGIYSDSAGSPGSLIGSSATVVGTTFSDAEDWNVITGISASITSTTAYWVVIMVASADSSNYLLWYADAYSGGDIDRYSGSAWTDYADDPAMFRLYKE